MKSKFSQSLTPKIRRSTMPTPDRRSSVDGLSDRHLDDVKEAHLIPSMVHQRDGQRGQRRKERETKRVTRD